MRQRAGRDIGHGELVAAQVLTASEMLFEDIQPLHLRLGGGEQCLVDERAPDFTLGGRQVVAEPVGPAADHVAVENLSVRRYQSNGVLIDGSHGVTDGEKYPADAQPGKGTLAIDGRPVPLVRPFGGYSPAVLTQVTGVPCHVAENPLDCVALGTGLALEHFDFFKKSLVQAI